ncbi:MAG: DUF3048 domain-containing protein [Candidatus Saccharimonadales bacterium]|jgi:hypothetical protein
MIDDILPPRPVAKVKKVKINLDQRSSVPAKPEYPIVAESKSETEIVNSVEAPKLKLDSQQKSDDSFWKKLRHWRPTKKQLIIICLVLVVVLVGGGFGADKLLSHAKPQNLIGPTIKVTPNKPATTQPTTVASTLTGLPVSPSVNNLPVTAVMIENSTDARPQSGLAQAGIVFEAVAEGGITRYMALYQDTSPGYIGPIRSVRPYYLQWALGFDAAIAHVGGSPEAIQDIQSWNVKDLDQFYNGSYYQRVNTRAAPHNVYTSIASLNSLEESKGYSASIYTGFVRKTDNPAATPTATSINFNPSISDFAVHYDYNHTTNSYLRSVGGEPEMDVDQAGNETQVTPKVVIALVIQQGLEADGLHTTYGTIGSGQAYIFQDGIVTIGTWQKTSNTAQFTFTDTKGQAIALDAGQTWITIVGSSSDISYQT